MIIEKGNQVRHLVVLLLAGASSILPMAAHAADEGAEAEATAIVVTGQADGYHPDAVAAIKTPTPLVDTPQTVSVLTRQQLDDQAVTQLNEALRYVPGVVLGQGEGHRDQVILRGQSSTADFFLDGLRDDAQYYRPLYDTERVEVLKGANALLFGRGGGGGVINRVSKTPTLGTSSLTASGTADSYGAWSLAADANTALSSTVAARIAGTYEEFANHRDLYNGRFIGVAPSLVFQPDDATRFTVMYSYDDDSRVTDRGVPSLNGAPITGYRDTFFGSPTVNHSEVQAHRALGRIDHDFGNGLTANASVQYSHIDKYYGNLLPGAATATTVTLTGYNSTTVRDSLIGQANLVWQGSTGAIKHTLLAGVEGAEQDTDATRAEARFGTAAIVTVPLAQRLTIPASTWSALTGNSTSHVRSLSAYVQDQIELIPQVQVVVGARYDDFRISSNNLVTKFAAGRSDGKWSPRVGLILKPRANISFYGSYTKSFLPQSGDQFTVIAPNTDTLAPEEFENLEVGAKWDIKPGLSATVAAYRLDRSNTRATDPVNPGMFLLTGKTRTKGIEASLAGKITPQWQMSLGYAHQDGKIMSTTAAAPAGKRLDKLPRHQFSVWNRYDFNPAVGIGLGVTHQSSQFATISNAVTLPAFTRVDAAAYFNASERVSIQVNVENVLNTTYYPSAHTDNNIMTGEPINARVTLKLKF